MARNNNDSVKNKSISSWHALSLSFHSFFLPLIPKCLTTTIEFYKLIELAYKSGEVLKQLTKRDKERKKTLVVVVVVSARQAVSASFDLTASWQLTSK